MNYKNLRQWLLIALLVIANGIFYYYIPAEAADTDKDPELEICEQVALAGAIKIYHCPNINLFTNNLGFMTFEP